MPEILEMSGRHKAREFLLSSIFAMLFVLNLKRTR